ncbi:MAG: outer membrane beta-barrel protein [Candidatus Cloacimonetes bacterium]|nr:outer membrane beta-barrel protein [Candidatus Cloacimonadota bacterium]
MKRQILILSLFMFLIWNNAYTQESTQQKQVQFGLGIGISDIKDITQLFTDAGIAPQVFLPINISSKFRIEPGIAYFQTSSERTNYESSSKIFSIGLGIFPMTPKGAINIYYGARIGFIHATSSYKSGGSYSSEESGNGFYVAPTIGGEYYLSNSFTLGGEAQLRYVSYKEKDEDDDEESTSTLMGTRTIFFIRVYF